MTEAEQIKAKLLNASNLLVDKKIESVQMAMKDASDSMKDDTKSSAGDKFETGREMMQIELNNKQVQLNQLLQLKNDLKLIVPKASKDFVDFGSVVHTNKGNYFISVALGKVVIHETNYFALSMASPIGQMLKGLRINDTFTFNKQSITITAIY
jgi:transcription elongation GreA/GreB family factor